MKFLPRLASEVGIKSGKKFFHLGRDNESFLLSEGQENIYISDIQAHVRDYKLSLLE